MLAIHIVKLHLTSTSRAGLTDAINELIRPFCQIQNHANNQ